MTCKLRLCCDKLLSFFYLFYSIGLCESLLFFIESSLVRNYSSFDIVEVFVRLNFRMKLSINVHEIPFYWKGSLLGGEIPLLGNCCYIPSKQNGDEHRQFTRPSGHRIDDNG